MTRRASITALIGLGLALLLGLIALVVVVIRALFSSETDLAYQLALTTYPEDTVVTLGDNEVSHHGTETYGFDTPRLDLEITSEGWSPHTESLELSSNEVTEVQIVLEPASEEAQQELYEHDIQMDAEAGDEYLREVEEHLEQHPVLEELPHSESTFEVYEGFGSDDDLALHLYLIEGHEDQGREDFHDWLAGIGIDQDTYEIIEHVEPEQLNTDDPPTWADVTELAAPDPHALELDNAGLSPNEVAHDFLHAACIHDGASDAALATAIIRAEALASGTTEEADVTDPVNPPQWIDAWETEAISYPWIASAETTGSQAEGLLEYEVEVCRIWLPQDDSDPYLDNPRTWTLAVAQDDSTGDWIVQNYQFSDTYMHDDPDESICALD